MTDFYLWYPPRWADFLCHPGLGRKCRGDRSCSDGRRCRLRHLQRGDFPALRSSLERECALRRLPRQVCARLVSTCFSHEWWGKNPRRLVRTTQGQVGERV